MEKQTEKQAAYVYNPPLPKQFGTELLAFDRGEGSHLIDISGKRYLDFGAGIAVNALGYGREDIAEVAYKQMKKLVHISNLFTTEPAIELGYKLISTGSFDAVHFGNSGSEANEAAIKYARLYAYHRRGPGHAKLLCFDNAFHGRTLGALSLTPSPKYQTPFEPLIPDTFVASFNDPAELERKVDGTYAGIIVEVVQGEGGLRVMSREFAEALNRTCEKHDVILIADEVQTGLGRIGYPYASAWVGLSPDIITLAKPLGGGLPLSATLIPGKINSLLHPGDHGTTFGGGPVTTAVAAKILDIVLDPKFLEAVRAKAEVLEDELLGLKHSFAFVEDLRGAGLLRGVAVDTKVAGEPADLLSRARDEGLVLLRSGSNVLRIAPPLVITNDEIREGVAILKKVFASI